MIENARWADSKALELSERLAAVEPSPETSELFNQMLRFRDLAVQWAHLAAAYVHPKLAAIAHQHTEADGSPVRPVINLIMHNEEPETQALAETPQTPLISAHEVSRLRSRRSDTIDHDTAG
jgi:hypothetical protein